MNDKLFSFDMFEAGKPQSGYIHLASENTNTIVVKYNFSEDSINIVLDNGIVQSIQNLNL